MDDLISRQAAIDVVKGIDSNFVKYIEELPSAQPQRWIPVSERLPEYGEKCLVDFKLMSGTSHCISTSYCYVQKEGFWSDTPFQYKAIAWQPLPDPYKEGEA